MHLKNSKLSKNLCIKNSIMKEKMHTHITFLELLHPSCIPIFWDKIRFARVFWVILNLTFLFLYTAKTTSPLAIKATMPTKM